MIFDDKGVDVCRFDWENSRPRARWALTDSSALNVAPLERTLVQAGRIVQTTSASREQWKDWIKDKNGIEIIFDLLTVVEIAAIA